MSFYTRYNYRPDYMDDLSLLEKANEIQERREESRTHPREEFELIARMWSAYLGAKVRAEDVPLMMIQLKVAREKLHPQEDNRLDTAGYSQALDKMYR